MDIVTINTYNKIVAQYDKKTSDYWNMFSREFIDDFINISGDSVLDLGSGPGRDGLIFQLNGKNVVCLDASESMIAMCKERGLESIVGTFDNIPFSDNTFDAVWSYTALLHIQKLEIQNAISEIRRVLKSQGILAIGLMEGDSQGYKTDQSIKRWFSYYLLDELVVLLTTMGFEVMFSEQCMRSGKKYIHIMSRKI